MPRIHEAQRPMLLLDVEVRRFGLEAHVAELARLLQMSFLTTFMGRGLLASDAVREGVRLHGTYLDVAGDAATTALLDDSDLPVMLGAILSDVSFGVAAQCMDFTRGSLLRTVRCAWATTSTGTSRWARWLKPCSNARRRQPTRTVQPAPAPGTEPHNVIVLNNQSPEMMRAFQTESRYAARGDWRFADMADVLGGRGHRVSTHKEFKTALEAAFAERGRWQRRAFSASTPTSKLKEATSKRTGRHYSGQKSDSQKF